MTADRAVVDHYAELTRRNEGFLAPATQRRLRTSTVLVAGCGSTGGAAVEPLVRLGVTRFLLADNGEYELDNLNRQSALAADVGRNKAEVHAERIRAVNAHACAEVHRTGISWSNVDDLVQRSDVVIDGVDVTERDGWRAKSLLHESAARHGRPVVTGYDMAGAQYVRFYDYRSPMAPFDGRITRSDVESASTWRLLRKAVPLRFVPLEMLESARRTFAAGETGVSQLVYASLLFGALASRMVVEVLDGNTVRHHTVVDVHRAVRPGRARLASALRKPPVLALALRDLASRPPTG